MRMLAYYPTAVLLTIGLLTAKEKPFPAAEKIASGHGKSSLENSLPKISQADLEKFVRRLASPEYEGRGTADKGERMATAYVAEFWRGLGLTPEGTDGSYFQPFDFSAGRSMIGENSFTLHGTEKRSLTAGKDYTAINLSTSGEVERSPIVFAGFGIDSKHFDSYKNIDVKDRWVLVFRGKPQGKNKDDNSLNRHSSLLVKARVARRKGAAGIIFVKGPNPTIAQELPKPGHSFAATKGILPCIAITDQIAASLFSNNGGIEGMEKIYHQYHQRKKTIGYSLTGKASATIHLEQSVDTGRNVIGRLMVGSKPSAECLIIGAHVDHIGHGNRGSSRAKGADAEKIHYGADDNASGTAAVMELAQYFSHLKKSGQLNLKRDILFIAWSGEEMGLFGSAHYVKTLLAKQQKKDPDAATIHPRVAAYLNMDMVGRLSENGLSVHGTSSSPVWDKLLKQLEKTHTTKINYEASPYLPSDSRSFFNAGVPILATFTGLHEDYHKPTDTAEKIDYPGLTTITNYMKDLALVIANLETAPAHYKAPRGGRGADMPKVIIGVMPESNKGDGVLVKFITPNSPASQAGIEAEDIILSINKTKVNSVKAMLDVIRQLKAKKPYPITIKRDSKLIKLKITPIKRPKN